VYYRLRHLSALSLVVFVSIALLCVLLAKYHVLLIIFFYLFSFFSVFSFLSHDPVKIQAERVDEEDGESFEEVKLISYIIQVKLRQTVDTNV
jgi:hypothetical protein